MPKIGVMFVVFAALFVAIKPATAQTDPKEEVLKTEAAFNEAKLHNDIAALDRILADEYIGVNQWGGGTRNKKEVLELFRTFKTSSLVLTEVDVRLSGDTATVRGLMNESGLWKFIIIRTYVKRQGRWQLLASAHVFQVDPDTMRVVGTNQ
jgi:hypothetical protein